ncbi:MAG TPA: phage portal protein, partial [Kribbella sp.]|nr:phage portal protein [Kribbella sp.]
MALPTSDEEWVNYLSLRHDAEMPELEELNRYYDGTQRLAYMHPDLLVEVQDRIQAVVINWPQLVVDAVEERMDVEGFRLPDAEEADKDLWRVWQANNMDEQSQLAHVDSLVMKRSYVSVGTNEDDKGTPLLTAESPLEMFADVDPRTRKIRAALKRINQEDSYARIGDRLAALYLPKYTVWYEWAKGAWKEQDRDQHGLGEPPVVSIVNRARLSSGSGLAGRTEQRMRTGRSELAPIIPVSNAANKIATDMMVAAEFLALPLRGLFGVSPDDLEDKDGNSLTAIQMLYKRVLTIPVEANAGVREFEFAGANLGGFHESLNKLAQTVASLAGLPPHYLGFTTDNPASADAIRSAESRLVKRCERKQRPWGGAYEQMCRIVKRFQSDDWDPKLRMLETIW